MRPGKSGQLVCFSQECAQSSQGKHLKGRKARKVTLKTCLLKFQGSHCRWQRAQTLQWLLAKGRSWMSLNSLGQIYSLFWMYSSRVTGYPTPFQKSYRRTNRGNGITRTHPWVNHVITFLKYHIMGENTTENLLFPFIISLSPLTEW